MIGIDLSGKTALITGGSQGLGAIAAARLHGAGANIVITYLNDPDQINASKAEAMVGELSERAIILPGDVRVAEDMDRVVAQTIERFQRLDILVCNAGILRDRTVQKMTDDEWCSVIDTNLTGTFHTCRSAAERLSEGGRIICIANLAATVGFFGQANYASANAGVLALTRVLCKELARRQITVNAVAPGAVLTEMGHDIPASSREWMLTQIPLGRFAEPHEVADCVLFLASNLASYISGQTIHVNGGWWG